MYEACRLFLHHLGICQRAAAAAAATQGLAWECKSAIYIFVAVGDSPAFPFQSTWKKHATAVNVSGNINAQRVSEVAAHQAQASASDSITKRIRVCLVGLPWQNKTASDVFRSRYNWHSNFYRINIRYHLSRKVQASCHERAGTFTPCAWHWASIMRRTTSG